MFYLKFVYKFAFLYYIKSLISQILLLNALQNTYTINLYQNVTSVGYFQLYTYKFFSTVIYT